MKKEVQRLIKRRRAMVVPYVLLALAGLVLLTIVWLVVSFFTTGTGRELWQTSTPTPTITFTPAPATRTPIATETLAATPTETPTLGPSATAQPISYTVTGGDSLFGIAASYSVNLCDLMAVNGITTTNLAEGRQLIIPSDSNPVPTATPLPTTQNVIVPYFVCPGDTLDAIATKFNSTIADITKRNNITDPAGLQVGQILNIRLNLATPVPATPTP